MAREEHAVPPDANHGRVFSGLAEKIQERWPELEYQSAAAEAELRRVCRIIAEEDGLTQVIERGDLSLTAQQKFDAALGRAQRELQTKFSEEFFESVAKEVNRQLPEKAKADIAAARQAASDARSTAAVARNVARMYRKGADRFMDHCRSLIQLLHPDRAPDGWSQKFSDATAMILELKEIFEEAIKEARKLN